MCRKLQVKLDFDHKHSIIRNVFFNSKFLVALFVKVCASINISRKLSGLLRAVKKSNSTKKMFFDFKIYSLWDKCN